MAEQRAKSRDLVQVVEAADRAGAIVTEHVRSIIESAETSADQIRRNAERDAQTLRREAADAADRVLSRIGAVEGSLGELVNGLRREADGLAADLDRQP